MKTPRSKELKQLNRTLKLQARKTYLKVLRSAVTQYGRLTGNLRPLGLLRSRDYKALLAECGAIVSLSYETAEQHFSAHQVVALIKKYPYSPKEIGTDPEGKALGKFSVAEHRCRRQNQWFRAAARNSSKWEWALQRMSQWIEFHLNSEPDLAEIYALCDFTGGANVGVSGDATCVARKLLATKVTCTPSALPLYAAAMTANHSYGRIYAPGNGAVSSLYVSEDDIRSRAALVDYNKVAFVPKTVDTHRVIAAEPLANGYLQKGVDLLMRKVLVRAGIDLSSQKLNQELARQGSLDSSEEGFCTIDLESASDSISIGLVKRLLPPAWFRLLDRVRSPSYKLPNGSQARYEKFCSMGNGFCFPLETIIFAACCHAITGGVAGRDYMAYGDDIIVRRKYFNDVVALLKRIGFRTNVRKTFCSGPFRESCGSNWYLGEDVTPFTLDFAFDNLQALFKFLNLSRRNERCRSFFSESWQFAMNCIPDQFLFLRPFKGAPDTGIDQVGLELPPQRKYWKFPRNQELQCPSWLELDVRPVVDALEGIRNPEKIPDVVMAAALRGHPSSQLFTLRRRVSTRVKLVSRSGDLQIAFTAG